MSTFAPLVIAAMIAVILSFANGVAAMAIGGSYNRDHGNQMMFWRVGWQAVAIGLLVLAAILESGWRVLWTWA